MKRTNKKFQHDVITTLGLGVVLLAVVSISTHIPTPKCLVSDTAQYTCLGYVFIVFNALLLLAACGGIVATLYKPFKNLSWRIAGFVAIFAYGVIVYAHYDNNQHGLSGDSRISLLAAVNNTLSIFFPSRGAYDDVHGAYNDAHAENVFSNSFIFNYYLVHLLAYIYGALLLISIIGGRMMNRARKYLYVRYRKRYIFFGASQQSILLASNIMETVSGALIIFILEKSQKKDDELFERLDNLGAVVLYRHPDASQMRRRVSKISPKTERYFFLDEDEDLNVKLALGLLRRFQTHPPLSVVYLYVKSEIEDIDIIFNEAKKGVKADVTVFSQSDLTARQFIGNHSMLDAPTVVADKKVIQENNILMLGFGVTAREILKKSVCDAQYTEKKLSVTIIDKDFSKYHADFLFRFAEAKQKYNINFNPGNIEYAGSPDFFAWLLAERKTQGEDTKPITNLASFNRIIIALGDDRLNIDTAQIIARTRLTQELTDNKEVIFAHVRHIEKYPYYRIFKKNTFISIFGNLEDIYTTDIVINEEMDIIAKKINLHYERKRNPLAQLEESWDKASIFHQNSSRMAVMGMVNILKMNGYRLIKETHHEEVELIKPSRIDYFARLEHARWNAFHRMEGISCWDYHSVDDSVCNSKYIVNGKIIKHLCLVDDFDELDKIAEIVNKNSKKQNIAFEEVNYKDSDRSNIREIITFLNDSGYWIKKVEQTPHENK